MGLYIDRIGGTKLPTFDKVDFILLLDPEASVIDVPDRWQEGLVCVAENADFDVAGYAFDTKEMERFKNPDDKRQKTWLHVPNAKAYAK